MQNINCPTCGGGSEKEIFGIGNLNRPLRNVICASCGLVYINPRPDEKEFLAWQGSSGQGSGHHSRSDADEIATKVKGSDRAMKNKVAEYCAAYLHEGSRVLDIGCGFGTLLACIREKTGVTGDGIELNTQDVATAKRIFNLDLFFGTLEEFHKSFFGVRAYDLIILHHTFEHLADPLAELRRIHDLFAPHGRLYIAVPNILNMKKRPELFFQAGHAWSFSPYSLRALLRKVGFKITQFNWHAAYPGGMELIAETLDSETPELQSPIFNKGKDSNEVIAYVRDREKYFANLRATRDRFLFWLPASWRIALGRILYLFLKHRR